ncbi:MAG: response regulator [Acidobacteria bacterium]|jgi:CheY-like chemotaxis protein|nr:MAG: response regulator [Acidobacteriota bacterium]
MLQVLLIDDDPAQLNVREAVLRDGGFEVCSATTAEEALAYLQEPSSAATFGVIVTDHILPGDSGSEFVRQLRALDSRIPVIVITGLAEAEPEYAGLGVSFLVKPCPPEQLIAAVQEKLDTHS